jgi:hypothetical protein
MQAFTAACNNSQFSHPFEADESFRSAIILKKSRPIENGVGFDKDIELRTQISV